MLINGDKIGSKVNNIIQPTYALVGERDFFVSPLIMRKLPDKWFIEKRLCDHVTHFPQAEKPAEYNKRVLDFLMHVEESVKLNK